MAQVFDQRDRADVEVAGDQACAEPLGGVLVQVDVEQGVADDDQRRRTMAAAAKARSESFPNWDDTARVLFTEIRAVVEETRT